MNKNFVNNVDIIYPELISSVGWLKNHFYLNI